MAFEVNYLLALQGLRESAPDIITTVLSAISALASSPVPVLAVAIILWCVDKRSGYLVGFNYTAANGLTQTIKCIACINRPWVIDPRIHPEASAVSGATGYSFPSGHSTLAASIYGTVAYVFRKYKWVVVVLVILILLTAFSRNWLGCHMPKDVIVGLLVSVVIFALGMWIFKMVDKHPDKDILFAGIGILVGAIALVYLNSKTYPLTYSATGELLVDPYEMQTDCFRSIGAWLGFCVAWIIERRFIGYSTDGSVKTRIIRGIIGAAVVALLYIVVLPLVLDPLGDHWGKFLKYFLILIVIGDIYPLIFSKVEARKRK